MLNLAILSVIGAVGVANAPTLPDPQYGFTLERYYQYPILNGRSPASPSMSPDGSRIIYCWNKTGVRKRDLWLMEYPSGAMRQVAAAEEIPRFPNQDDSRTDEQKQEQEKYDGGWGGEAVWSPDSKEFIIGYRGRTWIFDRDAKARRPLFDGGFNPYNIRYSPDGKYLMMMESGNLIRMDRKTGDIKQLTFITRPGTSLSDYAVSPNGKWVAVNWSDDTKYGNHIMMDFTKERSQVRNITRMWQGNKAVDAQVGLVSMDGGMVKYVTNIPRFHWLMSMDWAPDSSALVAGWKTEDHQQYTLTNIDLDTAKGRNVYSEKAPKNYINNWRPLFWTRNSKSILLGTDVLDGKFTNRQIIKLNPNGKMEGVVYGKSFDVGNFMRPKNSDKLILVTLGRDPLKSELRILEPNGKEDLIVLEENGMSTPTEFEGTGLPMVSEDGDLIASMADNSNRNAELYAVKPTTKRLTFSQLPEYEKIKWADVRSVSFPGPDGAMIHAQLLTRPGLDLTKKHPAVISDMYANGGKYDWAGYLPNYLAMELGYVVLKIDFRSSWGYGGEFNSGYYQRMGLVDSEEAVAAKKYLVGLGYVKPDRVGVHGWSYGGFLTCMIMMTQPGEFHAGVAVASVTEWKNYNHWYTTQRLGFENTNAEVYKKTSPITYADKLQGNLLLVHGMLDDNVLFQDSVRLSMKLIDAGKRFDQFYYPRDDHGIGRDETRPHVMRTIVQYLYDKLGQP